VAPPVFKTGLAGIALAGRFDSFPPPPSMAASMKIYYSSGWRFGAVQPNAD